MLIHNIRFLRLELVRISGFRLRECPFPRKLKSTVYSLPARVNVPDLSGIKGLHSLAAIGPKGFRERKFSSHIVEQMDSNATLEEGSENLHLPSTYDAAMEALSSLISSKKRGEKQTVSSKYDRVDRMLMYVKILDLEEHIAGLRIIHVAGTKGKGSTCAFSEAILRECGFRTGLFTSPHLIDVRERFRLNGLDISKDKFLHYFWKCWHQLKENVTDDLPMPGLFQFLTVLALTIFACEKLTTAEQGKDLEEFFKSTAGKFQTDVGKAWASEVASRRRKQQP